MKILVVVNSFKGSIKSKEINFEISKILKKQFQVIYLPISDGGDGFLECFRENSKIIHIHTTGPFLNMNIETEYLIKKDEAFIEIANICGIKYLKKDELNPLKATTYGVGKVIEDAIKKGAKKIYLGLGGTASNDAGCGAFYYLGAKFLDENSKEIFPDIKGILKTKNIILSNIKIPKSIKIYAVCDVKNKLLGKLGSAQVFGKQKGASQKDIEIIEKALTNLTALIKKETGKDISKIKCGAAAGGLASGLYGFLNAEIILGSNFIIEKLNIENIIKKSDLIITGEGKFDKTSFYGKITGEIIKISKKYKKRCLVITAISEIYPTAIDIIELTKYYPTHEVIKNPLQFLKEPILNYIKNINNN